MSIFAEIIESHITKQYEVTVKINVHARHPADAIRKAMSEHEAVTIVDVREV